MKYIVSLLLLCFGIQIVHAQEVYNSSGTTNYHRKKEHKEKGYDPSRLIIGGGLNAGFGGGYADVGISPIVGYKFSQRFAAGVGLGYEYYRAPQYDVYDYTNPSKIYYSQSNVIYPSVWGRFFFWRNLFASASFEYDIINFNGYANQYDYNTSNYDVVHQSKTVGVPCLLTGIGLRQPLGNSRVSVIIEGLYDVLQQQYSPYWGQPIFRVGVCVGL